MNTTIPLQELFNSAVFRIPQYQRAYSWEETPQLAAFIDDLRQQSLAQQKNSEKQYFMGTLLLHQTQASPIEYDIVDGQQRLTTTVIFIATGLEIIGKNKKLDTKTIKLLRRAFVFDEDLEMQKFHTIQEDNPLFRMNVLKLHGDKVANSDSPSMRKLLEAQDYFKKTIAVDEWAKLIPIVARAQVITYIVDNPADATQIFELQNDRGKKLTDLEALKSYLMHAIYLSAKNPEDLLETIQTLFAKVYRIIESLSRFEQSPDEDSILSYHCAGFVDWKYEEWRDPKNLVKATLAKVSHDKKPDWVLDFSNQLLQSYQSVLAMLEALDYMQELSELVVLDRMASFWPLLIKIWRYDMQDTKSQFVLCCRLMEIFAFKGYAIAGVRADTGASHLRRWAREFCGDFSWLSNNLTNLSLWWDIPVRFTQNINSPYFYNFSKADVKYILWKYENNLRSKHAQHQPLLTWRDFLCKDPKKKFSVEHISPQTDTGNTKIVKWMDDTEGEFQELALHRLGNLVLDTVSLNSSKQNAAVWKKLEQSQFKSSILSEKEISLWAEKTKGKLRWTIKSIQERHAVLLEFANKTWDPAVYYRATTQKEESEE